MKAVKANKEYVVTEENKAFYVKQGFDIIDEEGNLVAYGAGKNVRYDDHMKAVKEVERLQRLCAELQEEKSNLRKELETLKAEKKPAGKKAGE